MEILNYIRNLFNWHPVTNREEESKKRRSEFGDGYPYLSKHRRVGTFVMTSPKERFVRVNQKRFGNCPNRPQQTDSLSAKRFYSLGTKDASLNISDDEDEVILVSSNKRLSNGTSPKERGKKNDRADGPTLTPNRDDDDDDVLFVTCVESAELKAKRQGYKFFKSRMNSPFECARPRLSTIRHVRTPILTQTRRHLCRTSNLNDSIRPDEKRKYQEMLSKLAPNFGNFLAGSCDPNAPSDTPLNVSKIDGRSRARKLVDIAVGNKSPVIDLTEDSFKSSCSKSKSSTPCQSSPATVKDSSDSDIECLGATVSSKAKSPILRVNSLKSSLDLKPVCSSEWVQQLKKKHDEIIREKLKEIEDYKMRTELYRDTNKKLFEEALEDRIRKSMQITDAVLVEDSEDEVVEIFPPLTEEQENLIAGALKPNPLSEVLVEKFNIRITRHDIHTLAGLNWLNDEVINFYMNLLMERGKQDNMPKVHSFNTFFYPKLMSGGHGALRRWTKRVDVFEYDLITVPIHLGMHWCMAIIDFRDKSVRYYDSMGGNNKRCLEALLQYLVDERMDKKKEKFDTSEWSTIVAKNIPQQMNGSDCGMFSCTFAEFVCRNAKFDFSQEDMPYLRRKMVYEIITGKLMMS